MRRSFDYLAGALTRGLRCDHPVTSFNFTDISKQLKTLRDLHPDRKVHVEVTVRDTIDAFPELFGSESGDSLRDKIAHRHSVPAGQFTVYYAPGGPVWVGLLQEGETLADGLAAVAEPGRLSARLRDLLGRSEEAIVNVALLIPELH